MDSGPDQYALWDEFLKDWPIGRLSTMTLAEYSAAGDKNCFVQWLEIRLDKMGSIWGGSAFKFGIYHRRSTEEKADGAGRSYSDDYAWYTKYGASANAAFQKVRALVVATAAAAQKGDLDAIDQIDLGDAFKWKIAFHYQNRADPKIVGIFSRDHLEAYLTDTKFVDLERPDLYREVLKRRGSKDLLEFGKEIWDAASKALNPDALTLQQAEAVLRTRYKLFSEPTEKLAGFVTSNGRQLALRLGRVGVRLFVDPDIPKIEGLSIEKEYGPDTPRGSNIPSQAPNLTVGHPALLIRITSVSALESLCAAYGGALSENVGHSEEITHSREPLNQILYGPPGTGKTFHSVTKALAILDPGYLKTHGADRASLKLRFDQLVKEQRVKFVTFHQSFSYEDFVEGIRADTDPEDGKGLIYRVEAGVFRQIAEAALAKRQGGTGYDIPQGANVWKVSIGRTHAVQMREECFRRGEMRIGWGDAGDLLNPNRPKEQIQAFEESSSTDQNCMREFAEGMTKGDVILCLKSQTSIQAIGVVDGDYRFDDSEKAIWDTFFHIRPVKWLATGFDIDILKANGGVRLTLKTVYRLSRIQPTDALLLANLIPSQDGPAIPYVLIVDEINRGNVSRILGELITLLEESKRFGRPEAISAILPYSKREFWVPDNLYVIGTMNTADRSLTGLDIALRRRFSFEEMPPDPAQLDGVQVEGVSIKMLLETINARIEVLLDRDRRIGHTYFLPLKDNSTLLQLADIFRRQVLPLLQEYFFEDWERMRWVLNDHRKSADLQFIVRPEGSATGLFGPEVLEQVDDRRWSVNESALLNSESYARVIS
jgi:5-methylcytosine-specific restriction protein B